MFTKLKYFLIVLLNYSKLTEKNSLMYWWKIDPIFLKPNIITNYVLQHEYVVDYWFENNKDVDGLIDLVRYEHLQLEKYFWIIVNNAPSSSINQMRHIYKFNKWAHDNDIKVNYQNGFSVEYALNLHEKKTIFPRFVNVDGEEMVQLHRDLELIPKKTAESEARKLNALLWGTKHSPYYPK